jgi:hypothetical protein
MAIDPFELKTTFAAAAGRNHPIPVLMNFLRAVIAQAARQHLLAGRLCAPVLVKARDWMTTSRARSGTLRRC